MSSGNNTTDGIYRNNMFSKFSEKEFNFISENQSNSEINSAPDSRNIYGTRGASQTPRDRFKLVQPVVTNGRITGYQSTADRDAPIGSEITEEYTDKIIDLANEGKISKKEAMFLIRSRHGMIDAVYSDTGTVPYGAGNPTLLTTNTSFNNSRMRDMIYNSGKARELQERLNQYEERVKDLKKQNKIRETNEDGTGKKRILYYDEKESNPELRWKLFTPDLTGILPTNNPESERAILDEASVLMSAKNTRDPNDKTYRSSGPKMKIFDNIPTKKNKDGSLSLDEKALVQDAQNSSDRILSTDIYVFAMEELGNKLIKWFIDPVTGLPKDATIAGSFFLGAIRDHSSRAYIVTESILKKTDLAVVAVKSGRALAKWADALIKAKSDGVISSDEAAKVVVDLINGPIKPWMLWLLGKSLKPKVKEWILKKLTGRIAGSIAATLASGGSAAFVTGILVAIDLLTIAWDVYTADIDESEKTRKLIDDANKQGYLPGPYVQTNGAVKIPVRRPTLQDAINGADDIDKQAVPIGVERDKDGNPVPLKYKDIDPNHPTPDSNVPMTDPKTGLPIPGSSRIKMIYPKKFNMPLKAFFRDPSEFDPYTDNIAGFDALYGDTYISTWNDAAEAIAQNYITTQYNNDKASIRTQMWSAKLDENDRNGVPKIFSESELFEPTAITPNAQNTDLTRHEFNVIDRVRQLENLGIDTNVAYSMVIYDFLNLTGPGSFSDIIGRSSTPTPTQQNNSLPIPTNSPEIYPSLPVFGLDVTT